MGLTSEPNSATLLQMQETVEWFCTKGFLLVKGEDGFYFVKNRLSVPVDLAQALLEVHRWRMLWAADNWLSLTTNDKKELSLIIDNLWIDFRFMLDAPMEALENIYFQNPEIKIN